MSSATVGVFAFFVFAHAIPEADPYPQCTILHAQQSPQGKAYPEHRAADATSARASRLDTLGAAQADPDEGSAPEAPQGWPDEPDLPADIIARVRDRAMQLRNLGLSACEYSDNPEELPCKQGSEQPCDEDYDEVAVCQDTAITDGFYSSAFVIRDIPDVRFYMRTWGGLAYRSCVDGPFDLSDSVVTVPRAWAKWFRCSWCADDVCICSKALLTRDPG